MRRIGFGLIVLVAVAVTLSAASNVGLPTRSPIIDRLSDTQKARITESTHLRTTLGHTIWPGWAGVDIPIITYNEEYAFLVGVAEPATGWTKVPQGRHYGDAWELVPNDTFQSEPYYRLRLPASGQTPEAFTVMVGDHWVASLPTREWMQISFRYQLQNDLPPALAQIVPYRLVMPLFLGSSEVYVAQLLHESFHAYQGIAAPARLAAAETATAVGTEQSLWEDEAWQASWQTELDLLVDTVQAATDDETTRLTCRFVAHRQQRRADFATTPAVIDYERQREWLEGLAKYVELTSLRAAADAPEYESAAGIVDDPDFEHYGVASTQWQRQIDQIRRMTGAHGDGRFYYSGFAQAAVLDRLMPTWKSRAFDDNVWLEDLLAEACR